MNKVTVYEERIHLQHHHQRSVLGDLLSKSTEGDGGFAVKKTGKDYLGKLSKVNIIMIRRVESMYF